MIQPDTEMPANRESCYLARQKRCSSNSPGADNVFASLDKIIPYAAIQNSSGVTFSAPASIKVRSQIEGLRSNSRFELTSASRLQLNLNSYTAGITGVV